MESKVASVVTADIEKPLTINLEGTTIEAAEQTTSTENTIEPSTVVNETTGKDNSVSKNKVEENEYSRAETVRRDIERGVVTINNNEIIDDQDLELLLLDGVSKFEPLVKLNSETSGFTLGGLFGNGTAAAEDRANYFNHEAIYNMLLIYQAHLKTCAQEICDDQKMVMVSVKSVEACCMEIIQSMANYQIQKKTVSGQLAIVNGMMKQVEKTHQLIYDTFQTLQKLDVLLPTELRLDDQSQSRWSLIQKLFQDAKKGPLSRDV